jgi:16S rRNA (cytosine967-C5)-methyltransferase
LEQKKYSNEEAAYWLEQSKWKPEDQRLFIRLLYGTLEQLMLVDYIIQINSKRVIQKMNPMVLSILRVSAYQLLYMDRIPVYAAINEAVEVTKEHHPRAAGFVNAVLRAIDRKKEAGSTLPDPANHSVKSLALNYSHPKWMIRRLKNNYSEGELTAILKAHQEPPELTIRLNTLKGPVDSLIEELLNEGILTEKTIWMPEALKVVNYNGLITESASYAKGLFQIQSISSMLAVHCLDPQPGELIIDVAAAPGGKSMHMAQRMNNQGMILSRDISESRARQIKTHAERLGCRIIQTEIRDGTQNDPLRKATADRVLLDAPCSSLGMIRRKPELKYFKSEQEIESLPSLQLELLEKSAELLKPGGILLYATCTYLQEENHKVVETFLDRHTEFSPVFNPLTEMAGMLPHHNNTGHLQIGPHIHPDLDGFFMAKMKKSGIGRSEQQ